MSIRLCFYLPVWVNVWVNLVCVLSVKINKTPQPLRLQGFYGAAKQIRTADLILTKDIQPVVTCCLLIFDNVQKPLRHKGFEHLPVAICRLLAYIVGMGFLVSVWVNVWVNFLE